MRKSSKPYTRGHALFARWVESLGSQEAAAELIDCSQANVSNIVSGAQTPGIGLADRIRAASKNSIALADWTKAVARPEGAA